VTYAANSETGINRPKCMVYKHSLCSISGRPSSGSERK